jgi:hypothetical protein
LLRGAFDQLARERLAQEDDESVRAEWLSVPVAGLDMSF